MLTAEVCTPFNGRTQFLRNPGNFLPGLCIMKLLLLLLTDTLCKSSPATVYMLPEFSPHLRKQGSLKKTVRRQIQPSIGRTHLNLSV